MKVFEQKNRSEIGGIHLMIVAHSNTWIHNRRKRREAERLVRQQNSMDLEQVQIASDQKNGFKRSPDSKSNESDEIQTSKRPRLSSVCEEADAWIEEDSSFEKQNDLFTKQNDKPAIIKANVFVEFADTDMPNEHQLVDDNCDDELEEVEKLSPLIIKIYWLGGTCREAQNQILCYLRNRLK